MTWSPPAASLRAMARPMPRFPPVTRTDRLTGLAPPRLGRVSTSSRAYPSPGWDRLPVVDQSSRIPAADRIDPEFAALPLRALADAALQRAADLGAQHADFRAERVRGQRIRLSDARLETLLDADDVGLAVRVVVDGVWGFAATVDLTPEAAARTAEQAVDVARVAAPIAAERIELADEPGHGEVTWISSYVTDPFDVSVGEKIALLGQWSGELLAHDGIDHVDAGL